MAYSRKAIPLLETVMALLSVACGWYSFRSKYWPYVFGLLAIRAISAALAKMKNPSSNAVHVYRVMKPLSTSLVGAFLIFATFLTLPDVRLPTFQEQVFVLNLSFSLALFSYFRRKKALLKFIMFPACLIVTGTCFVTLALGKGNAHSRKSAVAIFIGTVIWLSSFYIKTALGKSTGRIAKRLLLILSCLCFLSPFIMIDR